MASKELERLAGAMHDAKYGKLDPTSTVDMVEVLQSRFKDRVPRKNVSYEEVLKMQGQQQVIDYIIGTLQELERKQGLEAHVRKFKT